MSLEEIKSIIEVEAQAIRNIPITEKYNKAVDIIIEQVHNKNGKLVISGMGKAGQIGTQNVFISPSYCYYWQYRKLSC